MKVELALFSLVLLFTSSILAAKGGAEEIVEVEQEDFTDHVALPPWTCCNSCTCTKSIPATCHCNDMRYKSCSPGCRNCERVNPNMRPEMFVCKDKYVSKNPYNRLCRKCNGEEEDSKVVVETAPVEVVKETAAVVVEEVIVEPDVATAAGADGETLVGRVPWLCCNSCQCTKSNPPKCMCNDHLRGGCYPGCANCVELPFKIWPPIFRCDDVVRSNALCRPCRRSRGGEANEILKTVGEDSKVVVETAPVEVVKEATAVVVEEVIVEPDVAAAAAVADGETLVGRFPWVCCNNCQCTKSNPPLCSCLDNLIGGCDPGCKKCLPARIFIYPPRFQCYDVVQGNALCRPCSGSRGGDANEILKTVVEA